MGCSQEGGRLVAVVLVGGGAEDWAAVAAVVLFAGASSSQGAYGGAVGAIIYGYGPQGCCGNCAFGVDADVAGFHGRALVAGT